jgi:hypothetical protein
MLLNINLNINKERQDYKIGTVCGGVQEERGWMKEIKVMVYGRWTLYSYMKQNTETSCNYFKWGGDGV